MTIWQRALVFACGALVAGSSVAQSRPGDYPNRPVRIIIPAAPGGATDVLARLIGPFAERRWNQPLIVENKPGASSQIGAEVVVKAPPDGYTLLMISINIAYEHILNPNWPYNPYRDFSFIGLLAGTGYALITHPSLPVRNLNEFVAYAKANKGKFNQAVMGTVGPQSEDLLFRTGLSDMLVRVPYKGGALAVQAVASGDVHYWTAAPQDVIELARQGRLRILAYTERQRHPLMPDVPTVAESNVGADDFDALFWFGLAGPAGMPAPVVAYLSSEMREFVKQPEVRQRIESLGLRPYNASPEDMRAQVELLARQAQNVVARGVVKR